MTTVLAGRKKRRELSSDFFFSVYRKISYTIENDIVFNLLLNLIQDFIIDCNSNWSISQNF